MSPMRASTVAALLAGVAILLRLAGAPSAVVVAAVVLCVAVGAYTWVTGAAAIRRGRRSRRPEHPTRKES